MEISDEPMLYAARHGHTQIVKYLLQQGVIPINSNLNASPLVAAAMNGHADIVALLMDTPNSTYNNNWSLKTQRLVSPMETLNLDILI